MPCMHGEYAPDYKKFSADSQSWASPQVSPQVRNCGLTKKVADLRTLAV